MKKATFFAAALLMGAAVTATPLQAFAASAQQAGTVQNICVGNLSNINTEALKEYLENCNWDNMHVITIPCLPGSPEVEQPGTPDIELPDVEAPEVEQPETPDINIPETDMPENNTPENDNPGTNTPETETPDQGDTDQSVHAYVLRIVELVNEERAKAGLNALTLKEDVTAAAQVRAVESETLFSHTRPDGTSFVTALKEAGVSYRGAGENIAWGQKSPEEVMQGWMNSAGHRANILNENYTTIGVGYHQNAAGVNYWSQLFTY